MDVKPASAAAAGIVVTCHCSSTPLCLPCCMSTTYSMYTATVSLHLTSLLSHAVCKNRDTSSYRLHYLPYRLAALQNISSAFSVICKCLYRALLQSLEANSQGTCLQHTLELAEDDFHRAALASNVDLGASLMSHLDCFNA